MLRILPPALVRQQWLAGAMPEKFPGLVEGVAHPCLPSGVHDDIHVVLYTRTPRSFDPFPEDTPQRGLPGFQAVRPVTAQGNDTQRGLESRFRRPKPTRNVGARP